MGSRATEGLLLVDKAPGMTSHDVVARVRDLTDGRGPDAVIDAVGMEAHGSPLASFAQKATAVVPDGSDTR